MAGQSYPGIVLTIDFVPPSGCVCFQIIVNTNPCSTFLLPMKPLEERRTNLSAIAKCHRLTKPFTQKFCGNWCIKIIKSLEKDHREGFEMDHHPWERWSCLISWSHRRWCFYLQMWHGSEGLWCQRPRPLSKFCCGAQCSAAKWWNK